jgi:hypothetical protein
MKKKPENMIGVGIALGVAMYPAQNNKIKTEDFSSGEK